MAQKYYPQITRVGLSKLTSASLLGQKLTLTHMALGDGDNPVLDLDATGLTHEVHRAAINEVVLDENVANRVKLALVIPIDVGGFTITELGVFDSDGDLIAISRFPKTYKPGLNEGSGREIRVQMKLQLSNSDLIEITVDQSLVLATKQDLSDHLTDPQAHQRATEERYGFTRYATVQEHRAASSTDRVCHPLGVWEMIKAVMSSAYTSTSFLTIATSNAVSSVYFKLAEHIGADDPHGTVPKVKALLSSSVTSASTTTFATPKAVKVVNDSLNTHKNSTAVHIPSGGSTGEVLIKQANGGIAWGSVAARLNDAFLHGGCIWFDGAVNVDGRPIDAKSGQPDLNYGVCDGRTYQAPDGRQVATINARDRFIVVAGGTYGKGEKGGASNVTLNTSQIPSHSHRYSLGTRSDGNSYNGWANGPMISHFDSGLTGGSQAHENRPPYVGLFLIKRL